MVGLQRPLIDDFLLEAVHTVIFRDRSTKFFNCYDAGGCNTTLEYLIDPNGSGP